MNDTLRTQIDDGVELVASDADIQSLQEWLRRWDIAVPLRPYSQLAEHFGDDAERALTAERILHLWQPVYDSRLVIMRAGCTANDELLAAWEDEKTQCRCEGFCPLPFLRAVWTVKPLILALPVGWLKEKVAA